MSSETKRTLGAVGYIVAGFLLAQVVFNHRIGLHPSPNALPEGPGDRLVKGVLMVWILVVPFTQVCLMEFKAKGQVFRDAWLMALAMALFGCVTAIRLKLDTWVVQSGVFVVLATLFMGWMSRQKERRSDSVSEP